MTNTEMNNAIATKCGWLQLQNVNSLAAGGIWVGYPPVNAIITKKAAIPDYCNDLNACADMEKTLFANVDLTRSSEWSGYRSRLEMICFGHAGGTIRATARQRARAFLGFANSEPNP